MDSYYINAKYILQLANKTHELFIRSEVEEGRQLLKLALLNLRIEDREVRYEAVKPFDTLLTFADSQSWLSWAHSTRIEEWVREFVFTYEIIKFIETNDHSNGLQCKM